MSPSAFDAIVGWWRNHPITSMVVTGGSVLSALPQYAHAVTWVRSLFTPSTEPYKPSSIDLESVTNSRFHFSFSYPRFWNRTTSANADGHVIRDPDNSKVEIRGWGCYDVLSSGLEGILGLDSNPTESVSEVSTFVKSAIPTRISGLRVIRKRGKVCTVQIAFQRGNVQASVRCSCPKRLFNTYEEFFISTCHSLTLLEEPQPDPDDALLSSLAPFIEQIRSDLSNPEHQRIREFFVLPNSRVMLGGSSKERFIYYEEEFEDLLNQLDLLDEAGFLKNVTPFGNNAPIYRITKKLIDKLALAPLAPSRRGDDPHSD